MTNRGGGNGSKYLSYKNTKNGNFVGFVISRTEKSLPQFHMGQKQTSFRFERSASRHGQIVGFHLMLQHLFAFSLMLIAQLVWFGMLDVKKVKNTDKRWNLEATFSAYLSLQLPSMAHYRENMVAQNTAGHQLYNIVYTIHQILFTPTIQQSAYF